MNLNKKMSNKTFKMKHNKKVYNNKKHNIKILQIIMIHKNKNMPGFMLQNRSIKNIYSIIYHKQ